MNVIVALLPMAVLLSGPAAPKPPTRFEVPHALERDVEGIHVVLVPRADSPIVDTALEVDLAGLFAPGDPPGIIGLCVEALGESTAARDKLEFERAQADLGTDIGARTQSDTASVSFRVGVPRWAGALALAAETVRTPAVREEDFQRVRSRFIGRIAAGRGSLDAIAWRVLPRVAFWGSPLGRVTTVDELRRVQVGDCARIHDRMRHSRAHLFVVGDVTIDDVEQAVRAAFGGWHLEPPLPAPPALPAPQPAPAKVFLVDVPGASQARIAVVEPGPSRSSADYEPTLLGTRVLGIGFSSRLHRALRDKLGVVYTVTTRPNVQRSAVTVETQLQPPTEHALRALDEVLLQRDRLLSSPPTAAEVQRERTVMMLGFPGRFEATADVLAAFEEQRLLQLGPDVWTGFVERIERIDAGRVAEALGRSLRGELRILVVGDARALRAGLAERFGAVAELNGDGRLVPSSAPAPARGR